METNLLDRMLNAYMTEQSAVTVTLQNKVRVSGKIKSFDSYVLILDGQRSEIIYRHAISSVSLQAAEEVKRPAPARKPAQPAPRQKTSPPRADSRERPRLTPPVAASSSGKDKEPSLNNTMKEGLLKWMQEQKAAK